MKIQLIRICNLWRQSANLNVNEVEYDLALASLNWSSTTKWTALTKIATISTTTHLEIEDAIKWNDQTCSSTADYSCIISFLINCKWLISTELNIALLAQRWWWWWGWWWWWWWWRGMMREIVFFDVATIVNQNVQSMVRKYRKFSKNNQGLLSGRVLITSMTPSSSSSSSFRFNRHQSEGQRVA